jgi:hypothetical protein
MEKAMRISSIKSHHFLLTSICLLTAIFSGCASNPRVFYKGTRTAKTEAKATLTTQMATELRDAGYIQIGTFESETTTHGLTVSKKDFEQNPQAVLDSISPENCDTFADYYSSLDKEVCREAAKVGGEKVRLEEIKHDYSFLSEEQKKMMESAMANDITVKFVTSVKVWSVWKKAN